MRDVIFRSITFPKWGNVDKPTETVTIEQMTVKELFNRDKDESKKALAIVTSDLFKKMCLYAKAEMANGELTTEQIQGAVKFEKILMDLPEPVDDGTAITGPGLIHDVLEVANANKTNENKKSDGR